MNEAPVKVLTSAFELHIIVNIRSHTEAVRVFANGFIKVIPDQPFAILFRNFMNASRRLRKYMMVAWV